MIDTEEWVAAWNSRDDDRVVALCAPDVEVNAVTLGVEPRHYRGHDGVRRWMRDVRERFHARTEVLKVDPVDQQAVVMTGVLHLTETPSGEPDDVRFAILIHLRDDKATWMGTFLNAEEACAAYNRGVTGPGVG